MRVAVTPVDENNRARGAPHFPKFTADLRVIYNILLRTEVKQLRVELSGGGAEVYELVDTPA